MHSRQSVPLRLSQKRAPPGGKQFRCYAPYAQSVQRPVHVQEIRFAISTHNHLIIRRTVGHEDDIQNEIATNTPAFRPSFSRDMIGASINEHLKLIDNLPLSQMRIGQVDH